MPASKPKKVEETLVQPEALRIVSAVVILDVFLKYCRRARIRGVMALMLAGLAAGGTPGRAADAPAAAPDETVEVSAASPQPTVVDELIYNDGDRVRGHLVGRNDQTIIFQSERFGLLNVPATEATVVLAPSPAATKRAVAAAAAAGATATVAQIEEAESAWSLAYWSPLALARMLRKVFGPWHGRFSFASTLLSNANENNSVSLNGNLRRKWKNDEVQLNSDYNFSQVNHVTSSDVVKADGAWRHDFPKRFFSTYRPSLEWDRAYKSASGAAADYVLLQQEVGAGVNIFSRPGKKLRFGLAENFFDVWNTAPPKEHSQSNIESTFVEADWKLPWRITLTDRGVFYYSLVESNHGWENRFEVNKKLTETLSVGLRHEVRNNNPDTRISDYRLLRFMVGLDF
jgi:hypothetical protein